MLRHWLRHFLLCDALACCVILFSACQSEGFPVEPYFAACTSDADCAPRYQCLPATFWLGRPLEDVCTLPCTTVDECPRVTSSHCGGDVTQCLAGSCSYRPCR
ncbi:MAG: hypothetical protein GXP55_14825 [Deltaproteobacteria bacterium]|nr:hypothetical protein [Deltaproteobacteria bacterium]